MDDSIPDPWADWRTRRDSDAFQALVGRELPFALDLARRAGCTTADADDVVQESLAILAGESGERAQRVGLRPWLARTVLLRSRMHRRAEGRHHRREALAARSPIAPDSVEALESHEALEAALASLPDAEREAVLLHYRYDLEYRDMAFVLAASEGTCRVRVHRAIARLQGRFGLGVSVSIGGLSALWAKGLSAKSASALVEGALSAASGAPSGTLGGVLVMNAFTKSAVVALVAAAVTAGGFLATGARWGEGPVVVADNQPAVAARKSDAGPIAPSTELAAAPELALTSDEKVFVRRAVLEERRRIAASRIRPEDSGLEILRRHVEEGADLGETLASFDVFDSHVHRAEGTVAKVAADGEQTTVDMDAVAKGAGVVEFGPGVFRIVRLRGWWGRVQNADLRELEIRGAGIDRTVLVLTDANGDLLSIDKRLEHLRIHDLTFDCTGRWCVADVRGGTSAIFEDVRFRGWSIAGYAAPIGITGGAYVGCRRCEFLGRQGTDRGGFGIAVRGDSIALLDSCLFSDVDSAIIGGNGAAAQGAARFENCTFENSRLADSRLSFKGKPEFPVTVHGGSVVYGPPDWSDEKRREEWGVMYAKAVDGVAFSSGIARCMVADLIRALDTVRLEGDPRITAISRLSTSRAGSPTSFRLFVAGNPPQPSRIFRVDVKDGRAVVTPDDHGGGHKIPEAGLMTGALPLVEVLRKLPPATEAEEAYSESRAMGADRSTIPVVWIEGSDRTSAWILDGRTGDVIQRPKGP